MAPPRSADVRGHRWRAVLLAAGLPLASPSGAGLLALDEQDLAAVTAQDGLEFEFNSTGAVKLSEARWITDSGGVSPGAANPCTGGVADRHACTVIAGASLAGSGGPLDIRSTIDVGADAASGGAPFVGLGMTWSPMLLTFDGLTLRTPNVDYSSRSIGSFGFRSQGSLYLANARSPLNIGGTTARLAFNTTGDVIYRQGGPTSPELSFGNFQFNNRFTNGAAGGQLDAVGTVGVDAQGLLFRANYADTDLLFDLMFKASPTDYDTSGCSSITLFGWTGGLVNPSLRLAPGGVGYGTWSTTAQNLSGASYTYYDHEGTHGGGARSEGLHIDASWDFDSDFSWVIGQAGGNRTQVRFSNWRRLGAPASPPPMLSMPVTFDVVQNNVGPAGICFGGGFTGGAPVEASCTLAGGNWIATGVPAGKAAFATQIRDGHLHAYNQTVEVFDPSSSVAYSAYRWSLLYTFGKLDADMYFYPEGRGQGVAVTTTNTGLKADITLTAQSPGYWDRANSSSAATRATAGAGWATNTHFMLADTAVGGNTAVQYGVGLLNADLLWRVRDMYFRVIAGDSGYPLLPGGLWLQTDTLAQYRFRGLLGGGDLSALGTPTPVGLLDLNLSANRFIFVLSPKAPVNNDAPVGFDGLLDLDGTSYFSIAEVSSPLSSFRLYDMSGRIGWKDGTVNLVSSQNAADGKPRLSIDNDLLFGSSANFGAGGGAPFISKVGFGSEYFGRVIYPGGTWHSNVTIRIPGT